ncbi:uracil-xanthine permease family protein [Halococcus saccharolyticus]|uniref:Xanthine/uracil permease family transport protein n=1 Tax=Halococcus saccharolyticus DSM 5350 TaxID=1227455 RepID=M0MMJ8_9EURY|nr:nucleobase:cation symporter-2 family protein [Halococcus saccharolyticus]EMA46917.1 xanthine/uracil permease family transport protein [Halococcus saccharolyticus DSM 5350]
MAQTDESGRSSVVYDIEEKPPLGEAIPLAFQHVLAMVLGNIAVPLIIASTIGLATGQTTFLVQMALVVAGVASLVQAYPVGPVGARLPIMMGTSFAFLGTLLLVGQDGGLPAIFGAALVGSVLQIFIGANYERFKPLFPPVVNGTVVMLIGLTLIPTGIDYAAGASAGPGAAGYASLMNLGVASLVFLVTLALNQFFRGILRIASVFFGIFLGYVVAVFLGIVDFSPIAQAGWFAVPVPLKFGIVFDPGAILAVAAVYLIVAMETIGNVSAIVAETGRNASNRQIRGGLLGDGVMSGIAAIFGAFPNTAFAQNVGLISFTGVASRFIVGIGGVILLVGGFIPKVGAVITTVPDPVLGGGTLILFAQIFTSGLNIIHREVVLTQRNTTIIAAAVSLGLGVTFRPELVQNLPEMVQTLFGSGVVMGGLAALVLNLMLPQESPVGNVSDSEAVAKETGDD